MKKLAVIALLPGVLFATPYTEEALEYERLQYINAELAAQGLPMPNSGVTLIPAHEASKESHVYLNEKSHSTKGYILRDNPHAIEISMAPILLREQFMLQINPLAKHEVSHSIKEVGIAFDWPYLPLDNSIVHGFSATGAHYPTGWSGAVQFFHDYNLGECQYTVTSVDVAKSAVRIMDEIVGYEVNGNVTTKDITGSPKTGFVYSLSWFNDHYFRLLECTQAGYNDATMSAMIELAKRAV